MQSVLIIQCFICKASLLSSALYPARALWSYAVASGWLSGRVVAGGVRYHASASRVWLALRLHGMFLGDLSPG